MLANNIKLINDYYKFSIYNETHWLIDEFTKIYKESSDVIDLP